MGDQGRHKPKGEKWKMKCRVDEEIPGRIDKECKTKAVNTDGSNDEGTGKEEAQPGYSFEGMNKKTVLDIGAQNTVMDGVNFTTDFPFVKCKAMQKIIAKIVKRQNPDGIEQSFQGTDLGI